MQTISFIEISIEAGILLGGKHEAMDPVYTSIIAGVVGYITRFTTEVMVPAGVPDAYNPAASSGDSGTGVSRCADDPGYSEADFLAVA